MKFALAALKADADKQMIVPKAMFLVPGQLLDLLPERGAAIGHQLRVDQAVGAVPQAQIVVIQLVQGRHLLVERY